MEDQSAPLAALMKGSMREATDGIATLDDIDEQTFVRFCEYAYMGDYTPAQRQPASILDSAKSSASVREYADEGIVASKKSKKKRSHASLWDDVDGFDKVGKSCGQCGRGTRTQILWDEFRRREYSVTSPKLRPRELLEECADKDDLFLWHARVYVFADRYDIAGLRVLALDKLHHALCSFKVAENQIAKIIDLARFSYSNDNTRDNEAEQHIDSLRSMVVHFIVCVFEDVVRDNSFLELVEERGPFARDFTRLLGIIMTGKSS
jgi:hypothetical protein